MTAKQKDRDAKPTLRERAGALFDKAASNQPSWATGLAIVLIVVSPVLSFSVGKAKEPGVIVALLFAQSVVAFLIFFIPYLQRRRAEKSELQLRADVRLTMADVLDPLMEEVATLANSTKAGSVGQRERIQSMVLSAASTSLGGPRARSCFYRLDRALIPMKAPDGSRKTIARQRLVRANSIGRSASRAVFSDNDDAGKYTIDTIVRQKEGIFVEDIDASPPPGWDATKTGKYKTFIAVPVRAKGRTLGMLTVDSMEAGDLTEDDAQLLGVFAWILAASLVWGERMEAAAAPRTVAGRLPPSSSPGAPSGDRG